MKEFVFQYGRLEDEMSRKDLTGQRNGKLVVQEMIREKKPNGRTRSYCLCLCDCGNQHKVDISHFQTRENLSCGCDTKQKRRDNNISQIIGNRYGRLVVMKLDEQSTNKVRWLCKCDCGNMTSVMTNQLTSGKTQSCGCLQREKSSQARKKNWAGVVSSKGTKLLTYEYSDERGVEHWRCKCCYCDNTFVAIPAEVMNGHNSTCGCGLSSLNRRKDLSGQKFGRVTVLSPIIRPRKMTKWLCKCDCGKEFEVAISQLREGGIKSCGCDKESKGEHFVEESLKQLNISYERQKTFSECKATKKLPFDFAIFDSEELIGLIEYDGMQHYKPIDFWGGEAQFQKRVQYDKIKTDFCRKNNIPLLRLPYTLSKEEIKEKINSFIHP